MKIHAAEVGSNKNNTAEVIFQNICIPELGLHSTGSFLKTPTAGKFKRLEPDIVVKSCLCSRISNYSLGDKSIESFASSKVKLHG